MQRTVVSPSCLQSSLQKMLLIWVSPGQLLSWHFMLLGMFGAPALSNGRKIRGRVPVTTTSFLGTCPQGKHRCWAPHLPSSCPPADQTCRDPPGQRSTSPRCQQAVPRRIVPPGELLPLLVIQLSGCKMNSMGSMMEKGALPALPAPSMHPLLQPLLFTCGRSSPACYPVARSSP